MRVNREIRIITQMEQEEYDSLRNGLVAFIRKEVEKGFVDVTDVSMGRALLNVSIPDWEKQR